MLSNSFMHRENISMRNAIQNEINEKEHKKRLK
jgi:hypothetical protein